jgi:nitrogen fixation protein NifQ
MGVARQSTASARDLVYATLVRRRASLSPNAEWLARMIASWCAGDGALPDNLGLEPADFDRLLQTFFPGARIARRAVSGRRADFARMLEKDDLTRFLQGHGAFPDLAETGWIIAILVAGCLGDDHLWQDLGLWSRADLSDLLSHNFPRLAASNRHNMKWKKFLYKQLCEAEGIYVCRAPSCEVCADYRHCFGSEQ